MKDIHDCINSDFNIGKITYRLLEVNEDGAKCIETYRLQKENKENQNHYTYVPMGVVKAKLNVK